MEGLSWEEKYLRLRDDHTSLTHKANEQDDTIRRMNTKLSQIEKSLKLKYRLDSVGDHTGNGGGGAPTRAPAAGGSGAASGCGGGDGGVGFGHPRNRENEELVQELHRYNGVLLRENGDLKTRIKNLNDALAKKKKELVTARLARTRAVGAGPAGPRSPCPAARAARMRSRHVQLGKKRSADDMDMGSVREKEDPTARKLSELVDKLRERVSNAETQLKGVRAENQRLRQSKIDAGCAPEDAHEQAMAAAAAARREPSAGRDREEVENLHRELREAQAKAQLIQARFEHLEARTLAQADLHEGSVDKLHETNRQLRDARRELQDVLHERDVAVARAVRVDDLEEMVSELRRQNKELEDQVTRLCESPFISQAFREQERSERVLELEQGGRAAQLKIDHLQETAQTHHAALVALQKQTVRLREEKERAERALQEMRVRHNETEAGAQLMADKMRLYAGDEDVDLEELERALTIVRRKMADPESFPGFLENPEDEEMDNVPALRRKLQRVQVSNLNLTRELERAERMLKAQMSINRDLHVELEEACRRSTMDRGELGQKLHDFESLALERLTTVHRLEAQVKQLLYGPARRQRLGATADASPAAMEQEQESALLSELAEGDFSADQNIVEVWVVGAELEPGSLSAGSSSFIVVDFFDFESQATPLLPGMSPAFDFATTFKVTVDDFFLRYLGTEGLVIELNQARAADFELVGRRQIPLSGLLSSKPRIVLQREPLISTRDGAIVGYVHVEVRMALPVMELYALFLERRPEEKERVEQARLLEAKAQGYLTSSDVSRNGRSGALYGGVSGNKSSLHNELELVIVGCRGLPGRGRADKDVAPAAYVHYQLLGFQDVFTPVVHGARDPFFRHSTAFPVATDDKLLRFLSRHRLTVTVMDDLANISEDHAGEKSGDEAWPSGNASGNDESEGLIGEAMIDLSPLAEGRPVVAEWATVEDATGRPAGQISVSARWLKPLRTGGDPGPHGLSAEEVEGLMSRFSPEKDGQVNYVAFLRESDPPPAVLAALDQIHSFLSEAAEQDGLSPTEALAAVLGVAGSDPKTQISEETFVSTLLSSGKLSASPDELAAAYAHAAGGVANGGNGSGSGISGNNTDRMLTLEHLAAFATYSGPHIGEAAGGGGNGGGGGRGGDWASWMGAARPGDGGAAARRALVKARVKCRDAGLLGRSFPGEAFSRLDPEGAGRVSRPAFKRALREMGFALVDESAPEGSNREEALANSNVPWRASEEGRGAAADVRCILGGMMEDNPAYDGEEVRLRRVEGEQHDDARRNAFQEKIKEIERAAAEKVDKAESLSVRNEGHRSSQSGGGQGEEGLLPHEVEPRLVKLEDDSGEADPRHPSSAVARDSYARTRSASELGHEAAACLLQSRYRGYRLRKYGSLGGVISGTSSDQEERPHDTLRSAAGSVVDAKCSVLDLEDFVDSALAKFEGTCSPPDTRAAFAKLDKDSTGFLDRQHFALALRGLRPSLELPPPLLLAAMDFFDTDDNAEAGKGEQQQHGSGGRRGSGRIDYRAFAIFCENRRPPDVAPAVNLLRTKPLRPGALDVFARRDPLGTGFVCRVDLFEGLRELGVSGTPPKQLRHLATMFEEAEDMVDYASLVAFASEQPAALRAASAVSRLRNHLVSLRNSRGIDLRATLEVFAVRDGGGGNGGGAGGGGGRTVLRQPQLEDALRELGLSFTEDDTFALYKRLDPTGVGVSCHDLVGFVEGPVDDDSRHVDVYAAQQAPATMQDQDGVGKLLRRAQATVVEAAQRMDSDFDAFDQPYLRYDWRETGRVGTAEFVRSTVSCGFPFTRAQAAFLAGVFGDGHTVSYPMFLSWATPGPDGLAASGGNHIAMVASRRERGGGAAAFPMREVGRDHTYHGGAGVSVRDRHGRGGSAQDEIGEDEAELKVRTALQRMGEDGISRAWEEFEAMDPGGRRGWVREEELVEVLAALSLPVTARDIAGLMRRFSTRSSDEEGADFLYPRLLRSVTGGSGGSPKSGRPEDILRNIRAELSRLVRRTHSHDGSGERRSAALRVFESLDPDGSGRVSRRDFRRALRELGFDRLGDDEQAAEILDHFDPNRNGRIRYKDFLRDIEEDEDQPHNIRERPPTFGGSGCGSGRATVRERLEDTLVRAIGRGLDYRREMELEEGRTGGNVEEGIVSRQSFRAVMKLLKADFSEEELKTLERRFAAPRGANAGAMAYRRGSKAGGEAGVRFVELLHWGTPRRLSREGNEEDWAIEERLRQMIRRRFNIWMPGALKKAFRHFDARREGKVSENDLSDGLHRLGLELTTRQERRLFRAIDLDGAGFLVYPDLVVFARDPNHGDVRDKILRQVDRATQSQLQEELERKDPSASGMISQQALAKVLREFGADFAGADLGRLMHRFDIHEDGTASIDRVLSFVSGGVGRAGARRDTRERFDQEPAGGGHYSDDGMDDDALGEARRKLRSALKLGTAKEMSPRRLFEYLDPDGRGEVSDVDLRDGLDSLGVKLTRQESRLLTDSDGSHTARGPASRARRLNFRQFSRMVDGSRPRLAISPTERGGRRNNSTSQGRLTSSNSPLETSTTRGGASAARRRTKGVTFLEEDSGDDGLWSYRAPETLRVSLRHLVSPVNSADRTAEDAATATAGGGGGAGNSVGPGLRDKLRGALQIAADARGAKRGQRHVDLETVRRAMTACGAPLTSKLLSDLGRRFDRRGTGEVDVEEFVDYVASEVEADVWERVSVEVADMQQGARRSSGRDDRGGGEGGLALVRAFMSDLSQFVDGRQEISRRDLRKALERQGVSTLREAEVLVLCDSIDPERRGRMRLSDVRRSLCCGMVSAGLSSEGEDESYGESSIESTTETAATVLDELRLLVAAAEREGGVGLLESFEHFDRRGQGEVSEAEFWEGLQRLGLGLGLPRSHASRIVKSFKGRRHGHVRYKDFVEAMEEPSSMRGGGRRKTCGITEGTKEGGRRKEERSGARRRSSADDIERLVDTLKEEIGRLTEEEDGPPPFRKVFEAADRRGAGTLPSLAFRRCLLEGLGLRLTEPECEALLDYLDTGGDNKISYREFLQFVGHEVRERTPPRSRSPQRARSIASAPDSYGNDASTVADSSTGGDRDSFVRSPPRQRRFSSPSREKSGARTSRRAKR